MINELVFCAPTFLWSRIRGTSYVHNQASYASFFIHPDFTKYFLICFSAESLVGCAPPLSSTVLIVKNLVGGRLYDEHSCYSNENKCY